MNKAVSPDGRPMVHVPPTGNIQPAKMMEMEKSIIADPSFVTLFRF
jgi:hypothetical protein